MTNHYLLDLVRYNPLRAAIVEDLELYSWSSHLDYLSTKKSDWLDKEFILQILSHDPERSHNAYLDFIAEEKPWREI